MLLSVCAWQKMKGSPAIDRSFSFRLCVKLNHKCIVGKFQEVKRNAKELRQRTRNVRLQLAHRMQGELKVFCPEFNRDLNSAFTETSHWISHTLMCVGLQVCVRSGYNTIYLLHLYIPAVHPKGCICVRRPDTLCQ